MEAGSQGGDGGDSLQPLHSDRSIAVPVPQSPTSGSRGRFVPRDIDDADMGTQPKDACSSSVVRWRVPLRPARTKKGTATPSQTRASPN